MLQSITIHNRPIALDVVELDLSEDDIDRPDDQKLQSLNGIEKLIHLKRLKLDNTIIEDLSPLSQLIHLESYPSLALRYKIYHL